MFHGYAWVTYGDQRGPRSNKQGCLTSMAMAEASRDLGPGTRLDLQTMLSLDPLMGARGDPNLFATGETAVRSASRRWDPRLSCAGLLQE
jgi:hypothetical protein